MKQVFLITSEPFSVSDYFQFFNNSDRLIANSKKKAHTRISKDELLKVTQLFTPKEIADYLTCNSLKTILSGLDLPAAKSLRILDPAAGTGNLLYSAYNLLSDFYQNTHNLTAKQANALIQNNLIGLEIDSRAASIAKRIFKEFNVDLNILVFPHITDEFQKLLQDLGLKSLCKTALNFNEIGSLSIFEQAEIDILNSLKDDKSFSIQIKQIIDIHNIITSKYDVVLVNPPYLASSDFSKELDTFITTNYKNYRTDLFMAFIKRSIDWLKPNGMLGVVCPYNWMFTIKYQNIRREIIQKHRIKNLSMFNPNRYKGATVFLSAFILDCQLKDGIGTYVKHDKTHEQSFIFNQKDFNQNPNQAMIFWTSERFRQNYLKGRLSDVLVIRQGLATSNNAKFLKCIDEVDPQDICEDANSLDEFIKSGKKYAPYNKGGKYRKWYGNKTHVIWFDDTARDMLSQIGNKMPSRSYYFKPCITWTLVSSKQHFSARYSQNSVFDVGGSCGFAKNDDDIFVILGYLCSVVATYYLNAQNPTLNCQVGDIKNLPYIDPVEKRQKIVELVKENIEIAKLDWHNTLDAKTAADCFDRLHKNECQLNKIFIDIYGLDELDYHVDKRLITLKNKRGINS